MEHARHQRPVPGPIPGPGGHGVGRSEHAMIGPLKSADLSPAGYHFGLFNPGFHGRGSAHGQGNERVALKARRGGFDYFLKQFHLNRVGQVRLLGPALNPETSLDLAAEILARSLRRGRSGLI